MLIPTCVLRGISKVRKVGHRTQLFGLGFQLGEFFAQFVNHLLQIFGMMPSRLIHLHHDKRVREGLGDMRKSRDSSWRYQLWAGSERSFSPLLEPRLHRRR